MQIQFEVKQTRLANRFSKGDRYDLSIEHILATDDSESFLITRKDGRYEVMAGHIVQPEKKGESDGRTESEVFEGVSGAGGKEPARRGRPTKR